MIEVKGWNDIFFGSGMEIKRGVILCPLQIFKI
jgi:hypothetical protein